MRDRNIVQGDIISIKARWVKKSVVSNAEKFVLVHEESFKKVSQATNITPVRHIQDLNPLNR